MRLGVVSLAVMVRLMMERLEEECNGCCCAQEEEKEVVLSLRDPSSWLLVPSCNNADSAGESFGYS